MTRVRSSVPRLTAVPSSIFSAAEHHPAHDVADVGPVADLGAVAPDLEGVLADEGAGDHGDHRVVLDAALAVDGEEAAGGRLETEVPGVGGERHLGHQLGPAVHVVGVVGRPHHLLGEIELLADVPLEEVRIDAARGGEDELLHAGLVGGLDQHAVHRQVLRAGGLVEVDIAAAAVDGGEMEDDVHAGDHALRRRPGASRSSRWNSTMPESMCPWMLASAAAGQVVDDADAPRALFHQEIDQVGADERSSPGDENLFLGPIHHVFPIMVGLILPLSPNHQSLEGAGRDGPEFPPEEGHAMGRWKTRNDAQDRGDAIQIMSLGFSGNEGGHRSGGVE